jgi:hypothetical protein
MRVFSCTPVCTAGPNCRAHFLFRLRELIVRGEHSEPATQGFLQSSHLSVCCPLLRAGAAAPLESSAGLNRLPALAMLRATLSPPPPQSTSPIVSRIIFAVERSLWSLDSVRVEAREVENRPAGCPRNNLRAKSN